MIPARFCRFPAPLPYLEASRLQEELVQARQADRIPDTLLLLEHPPVVTLGRRQRQDHLLRSPAALARLGIELHTAGRGGDVTYHAPGQWVLYPVIRLHRGDFVAHSYLHALEEIALRVAVDFGIRAFRRSGMAGAWCEQGKFCAVGFRLTRGVTSHGLALNVRLDLSGFDCIVGCGLVNQPVTSFQQVLGASCPEMGEVADALRARAGEVLQRELQDVTPARLLEN